MPRKGPNYRPPGCSTPGCCFAKGHLGLHSDERESKRQTKRPKQPNAAAPANSGGIHKKRNARACSRALHQRGQQEAIRKRCINYGNSRSIFEATGSTQGDAWLCKHKPTGEIFAVPCATDVKKITPQVHKYYALHLDKKNEEDRQPDDDASSSSSHEEDHAAAAAELIFLSQNTGARVVDAKGKEVCAPPPDFAPLDNQWPAWLRAATDARDDMTANDRLLVSLAQSFTHFDKYPACVQLKLLELTKQLTTPKLPN